MPFLYSVSPEYILNRRDDELFKYLMALFPKLTKEILIAVDTIRTSTLFSLHLPQNAELFLFIASVAPVTIEEHRLYATFSAGFGDSLQQTLTSKRTTGTSFETSVSRNDSAYLSCPN